MKEGGVKVVKKATVKKIIKKVEVVKPKLPIITNTVLNNERTFTIDDGVVYKLQVTTVPNITNNCQLFSIKSANALVGKFTNNKVAFIHILKKMSLANSKRLVLIDLNAGYVNNFLKLIDKRKIILNQPYTSSNGSKMNLFIVKIWREIDWNYTGETTNK